MMTIEIYVILNKAGLIQLLEHILIAFICPGIGNAFMTSINMALQDKINKGI
jgi:hypothetical protein